VPHRPWCCCRQRPAQPWQRTGTPAFLRPLAPVLLGQVLVSPLPNVMWQEDGLSRTPSKQCDTAQGPKSLEDRIVCLTMPCSEYLKNLLTPGRHIRTPHPPAVSSVAQTPSFSQLSLPQFYLLFEVISK